MHGVSNNGDERRVERRERKKNIQRGKTIENNANANVMNGKMFAVPATGSLARSVNARDSDSAML